MKRVLITGAAGFIGTQMVKIFLEKKYIVYALINNCNSSSIEKLHSISSDIIIMDKLGVGYDFPRFDYIFNLATVGISPSYDNIKLICDVNIKLSCELVDFAKENKARLLIQFGSCFEYGDHGDVLLSEKMECVPESLYAISKSSATQLTIAYSMLKSVKLIVVRPFGVFGEGEGINRLAPSVIDSCIKGRRIATTAGNQIRDFVDVKDVALTVAMLVESEKYIPYDIYNICSNHPVSVRSFIEEIIEVCGFDRKLIDFGAIPYRNNEAMIFAGDNSKLQNIIKYKFPINHKKGILDIYNERMLISKISHI